MGMKMIPVGHWYMIGKSEDPDSRFDGGLHVFPVFSDGMVAAFGMRVQIGSQFSLYDYVIYSGPVIFNCCYSRKELSSVM